MQDLGKLRTKALLEIHFLPISDKISQHRMLFDILWKYSFIDLLFGKLYDSPFEFFLTSISNFVVRLEIRGF